MSNHPQPPAPNWASGNSPEQRGSWIAPMIVGATIFATGCGGGLIAGWFAGVANSFGSELFDALDTPFEATVAVEAPRSVARGEDFDVTITITDLSGANRTVHDIDFDDALAETVRVVAIDPPPASIYSGEFYREHTFDRQLLANQSTTFTFTLQATGADPVEGEITVYLDSYSSETHPIFVDTAGIESTPDTDDEN